MSVNQPELGLRGAFEDRCLRVDVVVVGGRSLTLLCHLVFNHDGHHRGFDLWGVECRWSNVSGKALVWHER